MSHDSMMQDRRAVMACLLRQVQDWAEMGEEEPAAEAAITASFAALATAGPTADYADRIVEATLRQPAEPGNAKQVIVGTLDRLLAVLNETIVPSEVSTLAATIATAAQPRLEETQAARLAGITITRHVLIPRLRAAAEAADAGMVKVIELALEDLADGIPFGTRPGSRLAALQPEFSRCAEVFDAWAHDLVAAGSFALAISEERPDADPDDVVMQAEAILAGDDALAGAFMPSTPDDPLGTRPSAVLTAIGQAIEVARQGRSADYDWAAVQRLADAAPRAFTALLRNERLHVLDCVRL